MNERKKRTSEMYEVYLSAFRRDTGAEPTKKGILEWLEHVVADRHWARSTVKLAVSALNSVTDDPITTRELKKTEIWLTARKPEQKRKAIDKRGMTRLMAHLNDISYERATLGEIRDVFLLKLLISTGARVSEIAGLLKTDIRISGDGSATNGMKIAIQNTKTGVDRELELSVWTDKGERIDANWRLVNLARRYLKMLPDGDGPLFPSQKSSTGKSISIRQIQRIATGYLDRANIQGFSCHSFRHTLATLALESGDPLLVISKWLGHSKPSTTLQIYTDVRAVSRGINILSVVE